VSAIARDLHQDLVHADVTTPIARVCAVCGASLEHLRSDATYCSPAHRVEASRRRRLQAGPVDGYADASAYLARHRRTKLPLEGRIVGEPSGVAVEVEAEGRPDKTAMLRALPAGGES
jgi:hypothetical protein